MLLRLHLLEGYVPVFVYLVVFDLVASGVVLLLEQEQ